jgi:hypothetical protein
VSLRKQLAALWITSAAALASVTAWFVLNHFRVRFYNSAMEGPSPETSPYWAIVRVQDVLRWPILFFAIFTAVLIVCEFARLIILRIRR